MKGVSNAKNLQQRERERERERERVIKKVALQKDSFGVDGSVGAFLSVFNVCCIE